MKKGNIALEINAGVIEGPRGLSIKEIRYKETLTNGNNIYQVILENNVVIGEIECKKGDKGDKGEKGDTGKGILAVVKTQKIGLMNYFEIQYTDGSTWEFAIEDGESAYDLAVKKGFEGTEEEWLLSLIGPRGKSLEFHWNGTQLGIRVEGETTYTYTELKGEKGDKGDTGKAFYIAKTYSSVGEMQADFNNNTVKTGEYVIISSTDGDNGKIFEKKESNFEFIVQMGSSGGESKYLFVDEKNNKIAISNMDKSKFEALGRAENIIGINAGGGTGGYNAVLGSEILKRNVTGRGNVGIGYGVMQENTEGSYNVGIGYGVLNGSIASSYNIGIGMYAGNSIISGRYNIAIGYRALCKNTGQGNYGSIAIGKSALDESTTGYQNVAIGESALEYNKTGTSNVAIGTNALRYGDYGNTIGIGYDVAVTGNSQAQIGNSSVTVYCYGAVQNRSDQRDKTDIQDTKLGLDFILKLRPREFRWDYREDYINQKAKEKELGDIENLKITEKEKKKKRDEILKKYSLENVVKDGKQKGWRLHQGFIAQEVFQVMRELGVDFGGYQDHSINGGRDVLSLGYEEFISVIVKGIQEQQKQIEELKSKIEKLEGKINV